jgi:hypothetical protein
MTATTVELDRRRSGRLEISLMWHPVTDTVSVLLRDLDTGAAFPIPVARDRALEAFHHPYAYAASVGVENWTELGTLLA